MAFSVTLLFAVVLSAKLSHFLSRETSPCATLSLYVYSRTSIIRATRDRADSGKSIFTDFCFSSQIPMRIVLCTSHIFCIDLETYKMIFLSNRSIRSLTSDDR